MLPALITDVIEQVLTMWAGPPWPSMGTQTTAFISHSPDI